jgi:hypothetical protein
VWRYGIIDPIAPPYSINCTVHYVGSTFWCISGGGGGGTRADNEKEPTIFFENDLGILGEFPPIILWIF